jgi:drug/metabolite transporter (DMT)-like permease
MAATASTWSSAHRALLLMIAFAAAWAAQEVIVASMHLPFLPYQIVWCRYVVHLAFMLALFGLRDPLALIRTRRPIFQVGRSLLMLLMTVSWIMASHRVGPNTIIAVLASIPILVTGFGALFLRERPARWTWIAATLASAGCLACALPLQMTSILQLVLPLVTAVCISLYIVLTRSLRNENAQTNLFYTALGVVAALSAFVPSRWITPDAHNVVCLVAIGLIGYVGLLALDYSAAAAPVGVTAPLAACQIPMTQALAAMFGYGKLAWGTWAAMALIGASTLLGSWQGRYLSAEHAVD